MSHLRDTPFSIHKTRVGDYLLVLVLSAAYIFLFADRMAISILVEPLKREFQLSDGQIGLLQSAPILICYVLLGPLVSTFSDRVSRRWAIIAGLCVWGLLSSLSAIATSFVALLALRLGAGVGEVALVPSANAALAARFGGPSRNIAIGCFMSAPYVGIALAMLVGGWLLSRPDHGLFAPLPQWRLLFPILCVPGLAATVVLLFFQDARSPQRADSSARPVALLEVLRARPAFFSLMFIGTAMCSTIGYAIAAWTPAYLMRTFDMPPNEAGELLSVSVIVGGVAGAAGGSVLAALGQRFRHDAALWLALASFGGMLVLAHYVFNGMRPTLFALCALTAVPTLPFAGLVAFLQGQTPDGARARVGSAYSFCEAVVALTGGPVAVGIVTDVVLKSEVMVGRSIFIVIVAASLVALATLLFLILSRKHVTPRVGAQKSEFASESTI